MLDQKLIDTFCGVFGEEHRDRISPDLSMDDLEDWDSMSFLDLVMALESQYDLQFTDDEAVQMFQLGHIQRIVDSAKLEKPHEDIANGCCLLSLLRTRTDVDFSAVLFSGSSTREGLLLPSACESMLSDRGRSKLGDRRAGWFNLSISGLVLAETLQLLELVPESTRGVVAIGTSPVIHQGCGVTEFERSVNYERLPFACGRMLEILEKYGYQPDPDRANVTVSLDLWVERYLKGRDMNEMQYNPYRYPSLAPWNEEKYSDAASILRYYNNSILNHEQSGIINQEFYHAIADWRDRTGVSVCLVDLTLHPAFLEYFEKLGGCVTTYRKFIDEFCREREMPFVDAVVNAGLEAADFRDPAHLFQGREAYTQAVVDGILETSHV